MMDLLGSDKPSDQKYGWQVPPRLDQGFGTTARNAGLWTVFCGRGQGRNGYFGAKKVRCVISKIVFNSKLSCSWGWYLAIKCNSKWYVSHLGLSIEIAHVVSSMLFCLLLPWSGQTMVMSEKVYIQDGGTRSYGTQVPQAQPEEEPLLIRNTCS